MVGNQTFEFSNAAKLFRIPEMPWRRTAQRKIKNNCSSCLQQAALVYPGLTTLIREIKTRYWLWRLSKTRFFAGCSVTTAISRLKLKCLLFNSNCNQSKDGKLGSGITFQRCTPCLPAFH
eukprot:3752350-Karenia_brevis.AAC.1